MISIDGFAGFYWSEPSLRLPTLRALAERGAVAPQMTPAFPSTTWPTHVSLVTGVSPRRHGVVANSILNRATGQVEDLTGDPVYDAADLLRAATLYDGAHAAGRTTAAIDWPATRGAASLDFNLPFFKDQRVFESRTPPAVWAELASLGFPVDRQGEWAEQPKRFLKDALVANLAAHVARRHAPDLLLAHFLCADSFQHLYGPRSPEGNWAIEYIDERIGQLLATLPAGDLDRRTAVVVVSDHGFLPVAREVRINVRLRQLGLLHVRRDGGGIDARARFVANHGVGYVYVLDHRDPAALSHDLARELGTIEGVARVWAEAEYETLGLPRLAQHPHVGDLLVEARPGYAFVDDAGRDEVVGPARARGAHGQSPANVDIDAFFLAAGAGIRRGVRLGRISSLDVAPTVAHLLGVTTARGEGRLLEEILE